MTIYLCCEGVTDFAVLVPLMNQMVGENFDIQWKKRTDLKKIVSIRGADFPLTGSYKIISALATLAHINRCSHIAYHRDADHNNYEMVYHAVDDVLKKIKKSGLHCLAIIPKEMIESWLLSDKDAYPSEPCRPALPSKPEEIWGNKESDNHPKQYLKRVLEQFHHEPSPEVYADIAENSAIEVLRNRCPVSFGQFCDDMRDFVSARGI
jgi:hypothetical protein